MTARLYTFVAVTGIAGLYFLWRALQLPGGEQVTTLIGPRTWPVAVLMLMLGLLVLLALLLAVRALDQSAAKAGEHPASQGVFSEVAEGVSDPAIRRDDKHAWRFVGVMVVTILYTMAMKFTGYLVATAIFAAAIALLLGERRPHYILATVVAAVLLITVVFDRLLNIPLP